MLESPERRDARRAAAAGLAAELSWPRVLEPLVRWLEDPHVAADRVSTGSWNDAVRSLVGAARAARGGSRSAR